MATRNPVRLAALRWRTPAFATRPWRCGVLAVAEHPHKQGGHQARGAHSYRVAVSRRSYALDLAKGNTITQSIGASRILGVVRTIRGAGGVTAGEGQSRQIGRARQGRSVCSVLQAILAPVHIQHIDSEGSDRQKSANDQCQNRQNLAAPATSVPIHLFSTLTPVTAT